MGFVGEAGRHNGGPNHFMGQFAGSIDAQKSVAQSVLGTGGINAGELRQYVGPDQRAEFTHSICPGGPSLFLRRFYLRLISRSIALL